MDRTTKAVVVTLCVVGMLAGIVELWAGYVEPTTRSYGELIDAPIWNQDVVENIKAIYARSVTNGDTHDHSGGDGAQINHTTLSNIGTNSHATIDTNLPAAPGTQGRILYDNGSAWVALATGTSGYYLKTQGAGANPIWAAVAGGGVYNWLINGGFQVWQRGTSFISTTTPANSDDTYLVDRWNLLSDGNDIVDVTRETSVVPTSGLYAVKLDVETANKKFGIIQFIERKNIVALMQNGACSLSFKARKAAGNATVDHLRAAVLAWNSTEDSLTSDITSNWQPEGTDPTLVANWTYENTPSDLTLTDSYQTFSIQNITLDTASTANLAVFIWCDNGDATVGDIVYITDVQLETGATANSFARRDYQTELDLCQRYYEQLGGTASYERIGAGFINTSNNGYGVLRYAQKRAVPTITFSAAADVAIYHPTAITGGSSIATDSATDRQANVSLTTAGTPYAAVIGHACHIVANNTTNMRTYIVSEL